MIVTVARSRHRRPLYCTFSLEHVTGERSSDREDAIHQLCRVNREASCFTVTTIDRTLISSEFLLIVHAGKFFLSLCPRTWEGNLWRPNWCRDAWVTLQPPHISAQFSSWVVSLPFKSLHYCLQLCGVPKCDCSVLHIWFEHGSWTVVRRTCWGDQRKSGIVNIVLQSCFHVKYVGSFWWG